MMDYVEINKKYIRENIPQSQQQSFYTFFSTLPDFQDFNNWTPQRTIDIVQIFNQSNEKICISPKIVKVQHRGTVTNLAQHVDLKQFQTTKPVSLKFQTNSLPQKGLTALSLLEEIQKQITVTPKKSINMPVTIKKPEGQWLQFPTKKEQISPQKADLFKGFDTLIVEGSKTPIKEQRVKVLEKVVISEQKGQVKLQLKKSIDLKKQKLLVKQLSDLKQKRNSGSDKLFRYKLNQKLPCIKLNQKISSNRVSISQHQMIHRIFLPDYVIYHVNVYPSNIICKRTYDDFLELKLNLEKLYPAVKIPYIDSGSWFSESDISLINKNKINLEHFLNQLIYHPTLSYSNIVKEFLSTEDHKKIEESLKQYHQLSNIKCFSQIANVEGFIKINLSEEQSRIIEQLPKWQKSFQTYFERYIDLISSLTSQYESIKLIFSQLSTLTSDFQLKIRQLPQSRSIMSNFQEYQQFLDKQLQFFEYKRNQIEMDIQNLKQGFNATLKYEKLNINSLEPTINQVKKLTERYIKRLQNQPQSPSSGEQIYSITVRTERFTESIWNQSESINLFKYQIGYLNSKLLEECQILSKKIANNLKMSWSKVFDRNDQRYRNVE